MLEGLSARLTILDTVREGFLASVRAASPVQQAYQPTPQSWSVLGVTEHLVLAEEKSLLGMLKGPPPGTTVTPVAHFRMAMVRLVLKTDIRVKVPVARVLPLGDVTLAELEARWAEARRGLGAALEPIVASDAGIARFRHPIAGWVTAAEGVAFFAGHIRHHARQLTRIRRSAGFPLA